MIIIAFAYSLFFQVLSYFTPDAATVASGTGRIAFFAQTSDHGKNGVTNCTNNDNYD